MVTESGQKRKIHCKQALIFKKDADLDVNRVEQFVSKNIIYANLKGKYLNLIDFEKFVMIYLNNLKVRIKSVTTVNPLISAWSNKRDIRP